MRTFNAARVSDHASRLGEGPVWWNESLLWVDIESMEVHRLEWGASVPRTYPVGQRVGAIVPWRDQGWLLALQDGVGRLDPATGDVELLIKLEPELPNNRCNDGKCDPRGRFVVGTMDREAREGAGNVYRIGHDLECERVYGPTTISNGLAWSADGGTLYHIDTPTRCVRAFAYDLDTGSWGASRTVIKFPEHAAGDPDGMTIDADGNLWIALWNGWGVEAWNPHTGARVARVDVPAAHVTCPTFGGPDMRTLFITTASVGLSDADRAGQPDAGCVFSARPGVAGSAPQPFIGNLSPNSSDA